MGVGVALVVVEEMSVLLEMTVEEDMTEEDGEGVGVGVGVGVGDATTATAMECQPGTVLA